MRKRVPEEREPARYDKTTHYAATQTHEDRAQENHPYGIVRQGEESVTPFKYGVALRANLLSLQGEGKEEDERATNYNPTGKREPYLRAFEFASVRHDLSTQDRSVSLSYSFTPAD